jgi:hypothetical protein
MLQNHVYFRFYKIQKFVIDRACVKAEQKEAEQKYYGRVNAFTKLFFPHFLSTEKHFSPKIYPGE